MTTDLTRVFCLTILVVWVAAALLSGLVEAPANDVNLARILAPPGDGTLFGCDDLGRSVAARLASGARVSLVVAVFVSVIAALAGTTIGVVSGWYGGLTDLCVVRLMDVVLAFPGLLLAIALAGMLGPGIDNVVIALAAVGWVSFARLARAQTLSLRSRDHVAAARALGVRTPAILVRHVVPLIAAPLIVEFTFTFAAVIVAEASLSFLGLGVQPPTASWGNMIRDGKDFLLVAPHMAIAPGAAMVLAVLALNLAGDALRDRLDVVVARGDARVSGTRARRAAPA